MSRARKIIVSTFVIVHLGFVTIRMTPLSIPAAMVDIPMGERSVTVDAIARAYLTRTVTGVSTRLFAPLPTRSNFHLGAVMRHADGLEREFHFPRPSDSDALTGKAFLQFHKLAANLQSSDTAALHSDVCRYLARRFDDRPGNSLTGIELVLFYQPIPRHNRAEIRTANEPVLFDYTKLLRDEPRFERKTLHTYSVQAEDRA